MRATRRTSSALIACPLAEARADGPVSMVQYVRPHLWMHASVCLLIRPLILKYLTQLAHINLYILPPTSKPLATAAICCLSSTGERNVLPMATTDASFWQNRLFKAKVNTLHLPSRVLLIWSILHTFQYHLHIYMQAYNIYTQRPSNNIIYSHLSRDPTIK